MDKMDLILLDWLIDDQDEIVVLLIMSAFYECQQLCPRRKRKAQEKELMEVVSVWIELTRAKTEALDKIFEARKRAKTGTSKLKTEVMEGKSKAPDSSPSFSLKNCIQCLEAMEGVDGRTYMKALEMFRDDDWKEMFMAMSVKRRREWLDRLE